MAFFVVHSLRFSASLKSSMATEMLWIIMLMVTSTLLRCSCFKWFDGSWAFLLLAKCWKSFNFNDVSGWAAATGVDRIDRTTFLCDTDWRNCCGDGWVLFAVSKNVVKFIEGKTIIVEWLRYASVRFWAIFSYFSTDVGFMSDETFWCVPFVCNSPEGIVITGSSVVVVFIGIVNPRWIDCCLHTTKFEIFDAFIESLEN